MVRNYVRKTERQSWSEESMTNAVTEVVAGRMTFMVASTFFNVPKSTLQDRVNKARQGQTPEEVSKKGMGRYLTVFSPQQEKELVEHILLLENRLFGLSLSDLRYLAYELANRNKINHTFNNENKMAGKDWLYGFLRRHPQLSLRDPEKTSIARAMGFNRQSG